MYTHMRSRSIRVLGDEYVEWEEALFTMSTSAGCACSYLQRERGQRWGRSRSRQEDPKDVNLSRHEERAVSVHQARRAARARVADAVAGHLLQLQAESIGLTPQEGKSLSAAQRVREIARAPPPAAAAGASWPGARR